MNRSDVFSRLQAIFDDVFLDKVVVTPELSARDVEEWDSLLHVSLIVAIEKAFAVRFHVGEVEGAANVGQLADLICRRVG
jgi:acyl carrier protein